MAINSLCHRYIYIFANKEDYDMKDNALSVANYFIELAQKENKAITQLGLMKRVYIAHGFSLAINHKPLLDSRFDRAEAWKYGPVIPSVYHSFKQYKANPITEKTVVMGWDENNNVPVFEEPVLTDYMARKIVEMVWKRYHDFSDSEMVSLTHRSGTPWSVCYVPEQNAPIPDEITAMYYEKLIDNIIKSRDAGH